MPVLHNEKCGWVTIAATTSTIRQGLKASCAYARAKLAISIMPPRSVSIGAPVSL
jgi:hypothetical protein